MSWGKRERQLDLACLKTKMWLQAFFGLIFMKPIEKLHKIAHQQMTNVASNHDTRWKNLKRTAVEGHKWRVLPHSKATKQLPTIRNSQIITSDLQNKTMLLRETNITQCALSKSPCRQWHFGIFYPTSMVLSAFMRCAQHKARSSVRWKEG